MKAVIVDPELKFTKEYPVPRPAPGEALIRPTLVGICKTDLELVKGYMGFHGVLGHEFVGVVEECSEPEWVGARVVGEINCAPPGTPVGTDPRHLSNRTVLGIQARDGTMGERFTLPLENLLRLEDSISDEVAVFTEPLAAAFRIAEQVPDLAERILVLGDGRLGLLCALTLAHLGAKVTLVGKHPQKMEAVSERIACRSLESLKQDPLAPFPFVVEATGSPGGLPLALDHTAPQGTLVLKTTVAGSHNCNLAPIVINELNVLGSRCGRFSKAVDVLTEGSIDPRFLIEATYPLEQALEAFERASQPGAKKVLLRISQ